MTRATILCFAMPFVIAGCQKQASNVPDEQAEADNAPEEDFSPDEDSTEDEEDAPNLGKRRPS